MRILDIDYNELDPSAIDLEKGSISTAFVIKADATPIDNETKFAWEDDDYEEVQIYQPFVREEIEPTPQDDIDALMVDLECRLTMLELGITDDTGELDTLEELTNLDEI